jgi:GAF domain-containing protein
MNEQTIHLLIVDDEESIRIPLADNLRRNYHYVVDTARDGQEALTLIDDVNGHFDVALIDQVLEGPIGGLDLLKQIKTNYSEIQVIIFTGWGLKQEEGLEILNQGAYRYIAKPYNLEELALTIRFAAEQRQIRREHQYLSALVQISKELTYTTNIEDQLALVWKYIKEQLAVPTFFLALYDAATDTLRFHQSYDGGEPVPVSDRHLGHDTSDWGLAGYVIKSGQEQVWFHYEEAVKEWEKLGITPQVSGKGPSESGICVPLRAAEKILGALSLQSDRTHGFDQASLNAIRAFANQAAAALENSRLVTETKQKALNLDNLQSLTLAINSTLDLKDVLTQSCQAVVELLGVDHSGLVLFEPDASFGSVFAEYPPTERTLGQVIPVSGVPAEERLVFQQEIINVPDLANNTSLGAVGDILRHLDIQSILIVPVIFNHKVVASFSLDAIQKARSFSQDEIDICQRLADQVAVAIGNARLIAREQEAMRSMKKQADRLRVLYEIGKEITAVQQLDSIWDSISNHVVRLVGARRSLFLLVDTKAKRLIKATGQGYPLEHFQAMTFGEVEAGVSGLVLETKEAILVQDAQSDPRNTGKALEHARDFGTVPLIVAPLLINGEAIGTLTAANSRGDPPFDEDDKDLVTMLAAQAAVAHDNARRMSELEQLKKAAEAIAREAEWKAVLQEISRSAKQVLEADFTLIWPYDAERRMFFPEDLVAESIPNDLLEKFRKVEPNAGRTTERVLQDGYVIAEDLQTLPADFLGLPTQRFLDMLGVRSFQGIRLDIAGEPLGVLFVDYKYTRSFRREDRRILEHFANHAALTLKKARLYEQVQRSRDTAGAIAQVITLGDLGKTLEEIVNGARTVLRCDVVILYTFDEDQQQFLRSASVGYKDIKNMPSPADISSGSALWKIISLRDQNYHLAEDIAHDELLKGYFAHSEEIRSALGIPVLFGNHHVGVMFINYRTMHRFTEDEIQDALQFANQAAVAIHNALLHDDVVQKAEVMKGLYEAGKTITDTLSLEEALNRIAEQALHVVGKSCEEEGCFSHIALRKGDLLRFGGAYPRQMLPRLQKERVIDLKTSTKIGIVGRCVQEGKPQRVGDVSQAPDYIKAIERTRSQLSVPLKIGSDFIGVVSVEHPHLNAFTAEDETNLESLAAHAAVAIRNAALYEATIKTRDTARVVAGVMLLEDLEKTLYSIGKGTIDALHCDAVTLYTYDEDRDEFDHPPIMIDVKEPTKVKKLRRVTKHSKVFKILSMKDVYVSGDTVSDPIVSGSFVSREKIKSSVAVPLRVGERKAGVMFVNYRTRHPVTEDEKTNIELFANQAAVAIRNAQLHDEIRKRAEVMHGLYEAAKTITSTFSVVERLDRIAEQALRIVGISSQQVGCFSHIALRDGDKLRMVAAWPRDLFLPLQKQIDLDLVRSPRIGVAGSCVKAGEPRKVDDVSREADYIKVAETTRSQLSVPLKVGNDIVGVVSVEHPRLRAFTEEDVRALELLASQAAVAIRNVQLYGKTTQELAARTALAWTGMVSSTWRHTIEKHAITIREQIELLRGDLADFKKGTKSTIDARLDMMERLANQILRKPLTAPLSAEEEVQSVRLNAFIQQRLKQLWAHLPYKSIERELNFELDDHITIRANPDWLQRALDIVIDNAIDAMDGTAERKIVISTQKDNELALISVRDHGCGIALEVKDRLFHAPIAKAKDAKGLGMGLLFAKMIFQTYAGEIRVGTTGAEGTTMVISLPLET